MDDRAPELKVQTNAAAFALETARVRTNEARVLAESRAEKQAEREEALANANDQREEAAGVAASSDEAAVEVQLGSAAEEALGDAAGADGDGGAEASEATRHQVDIVV